MFLRSLLRVWNASKLSPFEESIYRHSAQYMTFGGSIRYYTIGRKVPVLTMFTKEECSLCDDAKLILENSRQKFEYEEVDITAKGNEEWFYKYRYDIPVFHLNGKFLMQHRINETLLHAALKKCEDT